MTKVNEQVVVISDVVKPKPIRCLPVNPTVIQ